MLTERDFAVVRAFAHYYVLNRPQVQRLCFPDDLTGRITRRRLQMLVDETTHGLVRGRAAELFAPDPENLFASFVAHSQHRAHRSST